MSVTYGEQVGSRVPDLLTRLPGYVGESNRLSEPVFDSFKTQALACRFLDTDKDHAESAELAVRLATAKEDKDVETS